MIGSKPEWLYSQGCCCLWSPADGCQWHTGIPAMPLALQSVARAQRAETTKEQS